MFYGAGEFFADAQPPPRSVRGFQRRAAGLCCVSRRKPMMPEQTQLFRRRRRA